MKRFLTAFSTCESALEAIVKVICCSLLFLLGLEKLISVCWILKDAKWRTEFGVEQLSPDTDEYLREEQEQSKVTILDHRDNLGRPIVLIRVKNHNAYQRDIDKFTRFIVYVLESACKRCFDEVIDNLCIVFDLDGFSYSNMDYQFIKNLIWLLGKHYPERLGVCLIINSSYLFSSCWMIIKPW